MSMVLSFSWAYFIMPIMPFNTSDLDMQSAAKDRTISRGCDIRTMSLSTPGEGGADSMTSLPHWGSVSRVNTARPISWPS